jgi:hypothetical protein
MTLNRPSALLLDRALTDWARQDLDGPAPVCPSWCVGASDEDASPHLVHRGRIWELPDRAEVCVMQVMSGDLPPRSWDRPTLYFWVADDDVFTEAERAQMANALRLATDLLCSLHCG